MWQNRIQGEKYYTEKVMIYGDKIVIHQKHGCILFIRNTY